MDIYLSFPDEATARSVLYRIEGAQEANEEMGTEASEGYEVANYANIDTIGVIYKGGKWDAEGNELEAPVALPGWHVNVRLVGEDADPLQPYAVNPATPMRVWG